MKDRTITTKAQLDLVLVNPGSPRKIYQSLASTLSAVEPPVWVGLLATFVRNRGFSVAIVDANAENLTPEETAERVAERRPVLTAVVVYGHQPSASTQNMTAAGETCTAVKKRSPALKVILVGGHAAAIPERTLQEETVDFVCGGEGPFTVLELLQAIKSEQKDYRNVRGLWYWDNKRAFKAIQAAPLVKDLDREMSSMAWDLLPMEKYRAHNWHCFGGLDRKPYAAIYTTLGCPYNCSFCCIQAPFKSGEQALGYKTRVNSYRFWHPDSVIAQIDTLVKEYGVKNIKIADEMFVLNPRHVTGICSRLIERGYNLNIWAYARVDTVKAEMVDILKCAGFNWLAFGIEAASERVRDEVQNGFNQQDIYQTLEAVRDAGINVIGNYIFGLPEDNLESMQATLDLARELNCEFANFYCAMAYPGSHLYNHALEAGWQLPAEWSGYSQHAPNTLPLPTKYLSASEVLRFRDHAFQVYFNGSRYLEMITEKFGPETTNHIREMASHKLVRQYA